MISNDPYTRAAVRPYNSRSNVPLELSTDPVLGLIGGYGYGVNGYGYGTGMYGLGYGGYGPSMNGLGRFHRRQGHRQTSQLRR
ncbi:hypothetical protein CDAR_584511 [Caerostris darwini]|uniref:Uncharacterized protein n=1 Tax=Caerostris darwini TaxID=1538125 RepID=A0AAV4P3P4_9ARAC|nr:hypothetical protein CDAR_584511 [Caerostris darwini]